MGQRIQTIQQALQLLNDLDDSCVTKVSSFIETAPELDTDQPPFINAACELQTSLNPHDLLNACQKIEVSLGRVRDRARPKGPRTIDIDIIFYGTEAIQTDRLTIPHPAWQDREFVKRPLAELGVMAP